MTANTAPIYPIVGNVNGAAVATANTALDGTGTLGTAVIVIATAGSNGSIFNRALLLHLGTNSATVIRIFKNNGSTNATPANNSLIAEVSMGGNTLTQTSASVPAVVSFATIPQTPGIVLKAGERLLATTGTTLSAGIMVTAIGGDY